MEPPDIKLRLAPLSRSILFPYPTRPPTMTVPSVYHLLGRPALTHFLISDLLSHSPPAPGMRIVEIPAAKPTRDSNVKTDGTG